MDQIILAVDDSGKFLEYIPKEIGHKGDGRRHLAIAVLLQNSRNQVLLQKRKHKIFDNIWDLTGATHPLHKPCLRHSEGAKRPWESSQAVEDCRALRARNDKTCECIDESLEEATERCLREEWGIQAFGSEVFAQARRGIQGIQEIGVFNYFAPYHTVQGDFCENEHCFLMVGKYDGEVKMNPEAGYKYKWMEKQEFLKDIALNPENYTPWAIEAATLQIPL